MNTNNCSLSNNINSFTSAGADMFDRNKNKITFLSVTASFEHWRFKPPPTAGKHLCAFPSRCCTCSHRLRPRRRLDYITQAAPRRSPLRQSASLTRRTSRFGPASSPLPSHCACCCCCCLVSTYADERRRHSPPSALSDGRF